MNLKPLGSSDLRVAPVILGTWALGGWLWGGTAKNRPMQAIHAGFDAGVNCIDTAPVYGFGLSEELVGRAIKGRRSEVVVATKCGLVWDDRPGTTDFFDTADADGNPLTVKRCLRKESIIRECEESLARLQVDEIDLYQCHWPQDETPIDETMEALISLRDAGKIRAFGVSNYSADQLQACLHDAAIASCQPKYSLLSREIEITVLPLCRERNIGVIAYSPMEMGLLAGKITEDQEFPEGDTRRDRPWFQPQKRREVLDALATVKPIADAHNATLAQMAIAWILAQPGITGAIVGARNAEQARSNAAAGELVLSSETVQQIREIFEPLTLGAPFDPATARR